MRAVELLQGRDSPAFRATILPIRPEEVKVLVVPFRLGFLWPRWVAALATPWAVFVQGDVLGRQPEPLAKLIRHELVHVRQWKSHGTVGFLYRYLADYARGRMRRLGHRDAYRSIALEVEARHLANSL